MDKNKTVQDLNVEIEPIKKVKNDRNLEIKKKITGAGASKENLTNTCNRSKRESQALMT